MQSCIVPVLLNINSNETITSTVASCGKTLAIQGGTCMCSLSSSQSWLYRLSTHDITHVIKNLVPGPSILQVTESWVGARCLELLIPQCWDYILYMLTTLLEIQLMFYAKYRFSSLGICPIRLTLQRLFQQLQVHHILV